LYIWYNPHPGDLAAGLLTTHSLILEVYWSVSEATSNKVAAGGLTMGITHRISHE